MTTPGLFATGRTVYSGVQHVHIALYRRWCARTEQPGTCQRAVEPDWFHHERGAEIASPAREG